MVGSSGAFFVFATWSPMVFIVHLLDHAAVYVTVAKRLRAGDLYRYRERVDAREGSPPAL